MTAFTWNTETIAELKVLLKDGWTQSRIAEKFGIKRWSVNHQVKRLRDMGGHGLIAIRDCDKRGHEFTEHESLKSERKHEPDIVKGAKTCQFPHWGDKDKPNGDFCGKPTDIGKSYCTEHHAKCYQPVVKRDRRSDFIFKQITGAAG